MEENTPNYGQIINHIHHYPVRVYYENTDAGGVVYHAEYLRFFERARTEFLRLLFSDHTSIRETYDIIFTVRGLNISYDKPCFLDESLSVQSRFIEAKGAHFKAIQEIYAPVDPKDPSQGMEKRLDMNITLVCVNSVGRPTRIPKEMLDKISIL